MSKHVGLYDYFDAINIVVSEGSNTFDLLSSEPNYVAY
jgi:hypothetical protein